MTNKLYLKAMGIECDDVCTMTYQYIDRLGNETTTDRYLTDEELEDNIIEKAHYDALVDMFGVNYMQSPSPTEKMTALQYTQSIGRYSRTSPIVAVKPVYINNLIYDGIPDSIINKGMNMNYNMTTNIPQLSLTDLWAELALNQKEEKMNTNWEFHSASDADINWKDIKSSLTYAEPLALVTRKYKDWMDEDKYVVINKQLWDKAHTIGMFEDSPEILATIEKRVFCTDVNFSEWVKWAKAVKAASWEDPIKSTLSVILPTV